jgi:2-polyprenyl-3-methyl-5-hydroxy-6-metoxy-1,4-benzoquinol methylase
MNCIWCGSALVSFQPTVENRIYHECASCEWIALDESHFLSPEEQKQRYLQHENTEQNTGYVEMFEDFAKTCIEPFAKKGSLILDYGCGPEPVLANLLSRRGYEVETYDVFFQPDNGALLKKYDVIVLTEVLEHLTYPRKVLEDLTDLLNPGGVLALMTLFHPVDHQGFGKWWYRRDKTHVTFYTVKTLEKMALVLGLTLLFSDHKRTAVLGIHA